MNNNTNDSYLSIILFEYIRSVGFVSFDSLATGNVRRSSDDNETTNLNNIGYLYVFVITTQMRWDSTFDCYLAKIFVSEWMNDREDNWFLMESFIEHCWAVTFTRLLFAEWFTLGFRCRIKWISMKTHYGKEVQRSHRIWIIWNKFSAEPSIHCITFSPLVNQNLWNFCSANRDKLIFPRKLSLKIVNSFSNIVSQSLQGNDHFYFNLGWHLHSFAYLFHRRHKLLTI